MSIAPVDRLRGLPLVTVDSYRLKKREFLAEKLFCLSAAFNTPLCLGGRYLFRCLSKIPGKDIVRPDFFANRNIERMVRVPLFIAALVVGFIGVIFAVPGTLAHAIACKLQRRRFTAIGNDAVRDSTADNISVLWWNVAGIAGGIGRVQGGLPDCEDRVNAIAQVIIDQNCDLVALTEVYDKSFQNRLEQHLKK